MIDQIFLLIKEVVLEKRLAIVDLLRLVVLFHKSACLHMLDKYFEEIQDNLISPASAAAETGAKKIIFLYSTRLY